MAPIMIDGNPARNRHAGQKPPVITWQNDELLRRHALGPIIKKIVSRISNTDVVRINLIGDTGTGKSTLADTLAHMIHTTAKVPFAVRRFGREELMNLKGTVATLTATNHIIIFDDLSFLGATHSSSAIAKLQQVFSEIRHLEGGQDIRIVALFSYHYAVALPPYLRQSHYYMYTQIGASDVEPFSKTLKIKPTLLRNFAAMLEQASEEGEVTIRLGKKKTFTYQFRRPFGFAFLGSQRESRSFVFPRLDWLVPHCPVCSQTSQIANSGTVEDFRAAADKRFGKHVIKEGLRHLGVMHGIFAHRLRVRQSAMYATDWLKANPQVSLGNLIDAYGLQDRRVLRTPANKIRPIPPTTPRAEGSAETQAPLDVTPDPEHPTTA